MISDEKKFENFMNITKSILDNADKLYEYDTFAANCIKDIINLMLSKDPNYMNINNQNTEIEENIDENTKKEIDEIINKVKQKINN